MQPEDMEPKKVFFYFSELAKIPHGSGNTEKIAAYCMDFAKQHNLRSFRDEYGNVMLFKDGTPGYEQSESVIIQGHLDMVCEKLPECTLDMEKEGISLVTDGEYLSADGTTLGGDDGIAIAYALALLSSNDIPHPPIEAVFTTDEEIGLRGARALDASQLKGRRLINIDSEEEGILTVSCAGGVRAECKIPVSFEKNSKMCAREIEIGGLLGGHSGVDIDKCHKNAIKMLASLLYKLNCEIGISVADISSGGRLNVIPNTARAVVCFDSSKKEAFEKTVAEFDKLLKKACASVEPDAYACAKKTAVDMCLDKESTEKAIFALMQTFDGVYEKNPDIPELVQTSSNLGAVSVEDGFLKMGLMIRSNTATGKKFVLQRLKSLTEYIGGEVYLDDDYPAWEYKAASHLTKIMEEAYYEMYGEKPIISSIHAGLECGILAEKLDGADMISIGPTMENVHTAFERLSVKSVQRVWQYLLRVLEMLK